MSTHLMLGVDAGSTNTKVVLVDSAGSLQASSVRPTPVERRMKKGVLHVELDAALLLNSLQLQIRELPRELRQRVCSIGITGQMHGMMFTTPAGKPLSPYMTWQDQRTTQVTSGSGSGLAAKIEAALSSWRTKTGAPVRPGMAAALLPWLLEHDQNPHEDWKICFLPDFLVSALTGTAPITDPTNAAASGLYDLEQNDWIRPILEQMGVEPSMLPAIQPSGSLAGSLASETARNVGLPPDIPVAVAIGDFQAAMIGVGLEENELAVNIGTGAQMACLTPACAFDTTVEVRPFTRKRYLCCHSGLPGGDALRAARQSDATHNRTNSLQSICTTYATALQRLRTAVPCAFQGVRFCGGALRTDRPLQTRLAETLGLPIIPSPSHEEASLGAALLARCFLIPRMMHQE